MGLVFPAKAGTYTTVAYGNLLVAGPYGFPPARERRDNEKALIPGVSGLPANGDFATLGTSARLRLFAGAPQLAAWQGSAASRMAGQRSQTYQQKEWS